MATQPRSRSDWHLRFLQAEEASTDRLVSFYRQAHEELAEFIIAGSLTESDRAYFARVLAEVDRVLGEAEVDVEPWARQTMLAAYSEAVATHTGQDVRQVTVNEGAVRALSEDTLDLIRRTRPQVKRAIQSQIAQGVLQGLSGPELRSRLVATGLRPGVWPSVEYRAGVIARTETMRAYDRGALDGIEQAGAGLAVWIVSPDEAVCPICSPLGGKTFTLPGASDADRSAWPAAVPLPPQPRHPRCRCSARAQFRTPSGGLIGASEVVPATPEDGVSADFPALTPVTMTGVENAARRIVADANEVALEIDSTVGGLTTKKIAYTDAVAMVGLPSGPHTFREGGYPPAPPGGDLAGWENRAKSLDSTIRKVRDMVAIEKVARTADEAAAQIGDLNRYTLRLNAAEYTSGVLAAAKSLQDAGNVATKWKPTWDGSFYRGLNSNWRARNGSVFEVQFHTPQSFQAKEINHAPYEEWRQLAVSDPRRLPLELIMRGRTAKVEAPPGWEALKTAVRGTED